MDQEEVFVTKCECGNKIYIEKESPDYVRGHIVECDSCGRKLRLTRYVGPEKFESEDEQGVNKNIVFIDEDRSNEDTTVDIDGFMDKVKNIFNSEEETEESFWIEPTIEELATIEDLEEIKEEKENLENMKEEFYKEKEFGSDVEPDLSETGIGKTTVVQPEEDEEEEDEEDEKPEDLEEEEEINVDEEYEVEDEHIFEEEEQEAIQEEEDEEYEEVFDREDLEAEWEEEDWQQTTIEETYEDKPISDDKEITNLEKVEKKEESGIKEKSYDRIEDVETKEEEMKKIDEVEKETSAVEGEEVDKSGIAGEYTPIDKKEAEGEKNIEEVEKVPKEKETEEKTEETVESEEEEKTKGSTEEEDEKEEETKEETDEREYKKPEIGESGKVKGVVVPENQKELKEKPYRDLQQLAMAANIRGNQKKEVLREKIQEVYNLEQEETEDKKSGGEKTKESEEEPEETEEKTQEETEKDSQESEEDEQKVWEYEGPSEGKGFVKAEDLKSKKDKAIIKAEGEQEETEEETKEETEEIIEQKDEQDSEEGDEVKKIKEPEDKVFTNSKSVDPEEKSVEEDVINELEDIFRDSRGKDLAETVKTIEKYFGTETIKESLEEIETYYSYREVIQVLDLFNRKFNKSWSHGIERIMNNYQFAQISEKTKGNEVMEEYIKGVEGDMLIVKKDSKICRAMYNRFDQDEKEFLEHIHDNISSKYIEKDDNDEKLTPIVKIEI